MLTFYPLFLLPWIRELSMLMETSYYFGFESGQHVDIQLICSPDLGLESGQYVEIIIMFSIALEWRVDNMLRF